LPEIDASVRTRVVFWNEAAERHPCESAWRLETAAAAAAGWHVRECTPSLPYDSAASATEVRRRTLHESGTSVIAALLELE